MARLKACPDCGLEVARTTKVCPKCGLRLNKVGCIGWLARLLALVFIALFLATLLISKR